MRDDDLLSSEDRLTVRQKKVLRFIEHYTQAHGFAPSVRDIAEAIGVKSTSTVHSCLRRLEELHFIEHDELHSRTIRLVKMNALTPKSMMIVPLVGKITAGVPILANENIEQYFPLPSSFVRSEDSFVLVVEGESMIDAGIHNGDYLVVRRQDFADDGDIVVALLGDSATVKRFFLEGRNVRLQPENATMKPIIVPADEVKVQGKVIGLMRYVR